MRLWKTVILVNLALALGVLAGYHWWAQEVERLRRELDMVRSSPPAAPVAVKSWRVTGIVRGVAGSDGRILITHEPIPGLMGAMTMSFRVANRTLLTGLSLGDRVQFSLVQADKDLVLVSLRKEERP